MSTLSRHSKHVSYDEDLRQLRTISSPKRSPDLKTSSLRDRIGQYSGWRTEQLNLWLLSTEGQTISQTSFNQGELLRPRGTRSIFPDGSEMPVV